MRIRPGRRSKEEERAFQRADWMLKRIKRREHSFTFTGTGDVSEIEFPEAYEPGTTRVIVNGVVERKDGNGYAETKDIHDVYRYITPSSVNSFRSGHACVAYYIPRSIVGGQ